ncbi:adiponectin receptor 1b [Mitosporidium daphniae]|uniref:Adiponectin receptor 1b n=1 Tax=Mitosporidium daphniae TaxID=1485682 RepID=A0A098VT75_9MICR|nr:adiponectin receptor 1b [Mitosporidium daphniae]KGG52185.1 adiponectin receptor 1b [Mitosporidium daphniae]|eukprot:XP_013238612.1 adiponectin receptor 1b [Mitosporidium daphniae]
MRYFHFHEVPSHLQDNLYILSGYRAHYNFSQCFKSIFAIHNETGNIWTHLIGALVFLVFLIVGYQNLPQHATSLDYAMVTIFLVSAIKCLLCSTIFHTFSCHSHSSVYDIVAILDYSGISLLILGSFVIYLNYALYCHNTLRWVYIALVTVLCLSGVVLPWFPFFRTNEFRVWRTLFFVGMGIAAGLISAHSIFLNGWTQWSDLVPAEYLLIEIVLYLAGAYVYVVRIPEAWFPGKLDHFFHSHQVWHVMVFLAAFFHYIASIRLMDSRLANDTCALYN